MTDRTAAAAVDRRPEPVLDPAFGARPVDPRGQAMLAELQTIHTMLRDNLDVVERLSKAVADGVDAIEIQGRVALLAGVGGLRMLQVNCLTYCRFVHGHHGLEDAAMFPRLRAANPGIGPVVDRLEADHRHVSVLVDDVEAAAARLGGSDQAGTDVVGALGALRRHLLEHLAYEEEALAGTLSRMTGWA